MMRLIWRMCLWNKGVWMSRACGTLHSVAFRWRYCYGVIDHLFPVRRGYATHVRAATALERWCKRTVSKIAQTQTLNRVHEAALSHIRTDF